MPRRSTIDAILDEVLSELETEFEAQIGEKHSFRWWVSWREFGTGWQIMDDLSTKDEDHTPEEALDRHSAVVQWAYKQLRARGLKRGEMKVERFVEGKLDRRGPDKKGREDSGCSSVLLSKPLRIDDCVLANR